MNVSIMALLRYRARFCSSLSLGDLLTVTAETWYDGRHGNNDLYAFDLANATWTELAPAGTLPMKRFGAGVAFSAGRVYVLGGWSGGHGACITQVLYSVVAFCCIRNFKSSFRRQYILDACPMTLPPGPHHCSESFRSLPLKLCIVLLSSISGVLGDFFAFDPAFGGGGTWIALASGAQRFFLGCSGAPDGRVYAFGGTDSNFSECRQE